MEKIVKKLNSIELTKKLISLPSYVDGCSDERECSEFLYQYLKQFKWLTVEKQYISKTRFNIIATDNYPTKYIYMGHVDTVQNRSGWKTPALKGVERAKRIYGLGASDMKASIATFLSALSQTDKTQGLMIFLYVDEEYDFLGVKKFVEEYSKKLNPKLIISGDGCDMTVNLGCRGLIEIKFAVQGVTGHASRPELGKNAIMISNQIITELTQILKEQFKTPELGSTSCNLAYMQGGLNLGNGQIGREGNNIADYAEFILDIRTGTTKINASKVISLVKELLNQKGVTLLDTQVRHDLGAWITPQKQIKKYYKTISSVKELDFSNPGNSGFVDNQLIWKEFNRVPCFTLGPGCGKTAHKPNEYVEIKNILLLEKIYFALINTLLKGGDNNE